MLVIFSLEDLDALGSSNGVKKTCIRNRKLSHVPEDLFKLFDFIVGVFFGAGVVEERSRISKWSCVYLMRETTLY